MATISKLNCFGGFGDVIEETPSPTEAMILSEYFNDKIRRGERFLLDNSTFGFQEHQVPEEIWKAFPEWILKYNDYDVWRRSDVNDKTILLIAVEGRGTREARMTVLARFIPQPSDMERPRVKQSVSTLGEMKEQITEKFKKDSELGHPNVLLGILCSLILMWVMIFSVSLLNLYISMDILWTIPIFMVLGSGYAIIAAEIVAGKVAKTKFFRRQNTPPIIRACNIHNAELAEAKARLETS